MTKKDERKKAELKPEADGERFLSRAEVLDITGVTYPFIWKMIRAGEFPAAREISDRRICWLASEVRKWMQSRPRRMLKGMEAA
jgi:predicted DNA-binding transcriptional regulator AlpA